MKDYIFRAEKRIKMLEFLKNEEAYADVVRESQEVVELLLKGLMIAFGLDVPKVHDVTKYIEQNIEIFPEIVKGNIEKLKTISKTLRKERELSFYGLIDWIPSEEYTLEDADKAINWAKEVFHIVTNALDF
ncbi:HEPN domain-containing protein [Thermodesulfovibrio sp. 1176]|nr:HEPN domain-containing protein [Thermodesulfovibrio sp. 1176]